MESVHILAQANGEASAPDSWIVLPLVRQKVIFGLFGWAFGIITGGGLFALVAPIMIPHNYQLGIFAAIVSTLILAMLLYV
ncbi:MAG: hypothetical protein ACRDHW_11480, partial [Ktedonobacteraceae bacterium]